MDCGLTVIDFVKVVVLLSHTVRDSGIILILALAEEEDFTKYIPQPEFIDDYGKVSTLHVHCLEKA